MTGNTTGGPSAAVLSSRGSGGGHLGDSIARKPNPTSVRGDGSTRMMRAGTPMTWAGRADQEAAAAEGCREETRCSGRRRLGGECSSG